MKTTWKCSPNLHAMATLDLKNGANLKEQKVNGQTMQEQTLRSGSPRMAPPQKGSLKGGTHPGEITAGMAIKYWIYNLYGLE
ncbi:MAG: hypothetical protein ACP5SH_27365 [Syntrophobacteraceae bacterium]